jgi:metal-responsive CopG/Arc/MetJ family transcriptional regulator
MKTAISIPDPIFQAAELFANHFGISRSELYAKAIEEYIASRRFMNVTEALNKIYGDEPSNLDDELYSMQIKSIPHEEW